MKNDKISKVIVSLYNQDPSTVNDDRKLIDQVYKALGYDERKNFYDNICRLPLPDSITRRRRELHKDGLIVYSKKVDAHREEKYKEIRDEKSLYNPAKYV